MRAAAVMMTAAPWSPLPKPALRCASGVGPVDVAVVGAGPAGLAAAILLASAGARVAVVPVLPLDQHPSLADIGGLALGIDDPPAQLVDSLGEVAWSLLECAHRALRRARELALGLGALCSTDGPLRLAANPREAQLLNACLSTWSALGVEAQALGSAQILQRLGLEQGPWQVGFALGDGAAVDPSRLLAGLLELADGAGCSVLEPVLDLHIQDQGAGMRLRGAGLDLSAEIVLVAAGVQSARLLPELGAALTPAYEQALVTAPRGGAAALYTANGGFEGGGHLPDGRFCLRGFRYLDPWMGMGPEQPALNGKVSARQRAFVEQLGLGGVEVQGSWLRQLDVPCDGLPLAGAVAGSPRKHVLAGLMGHEVDLGVGLAEGIARQILGQAAELPTALAPRRLVV